MTLPKEVLQKTEDLISGVPISNLKQVAGQLSDTYRNSARTGAELINNNLSVLAYIASRMPATYSAISFTLNQAKPQLDELGIKTVLDVGAGPGTATIAIGENFKDVEVTLLERNSNMVAVGKELLSKLNIVNHWQEDDITKTDIKADLIVSAYMLNEIPKSAIESTVTKLYNNANKALIIVDNGTKDASQNLKKVRETLISLGANIVAPCANHNECKNEWCHFSVRVQRTKLHKILKGGEAPYEDEKFTYIVAIKTPCESEERILRHPKILKGRVQLQLCTRNGVENKVITKQQKELYKLARKLNWGDSL